MHSRQCAVSSKQFRKLLRTTECLPDLLNTEYCILPTAHCLLTTYLLPAEMSAALPSENFSFKNYYWWFQAGGWSCFIALSAALDYISNKLTTSTVYWLIIAWFLCTALTEMLRWIIIRFHWLELKGIQVVARVGVMVVLLGAIMASLSSFYLTLADRSQTLFDSSLFIRNIVNYSIAFTIWSSMYFLINTLENFRKAEIENLRWQALRTETELNRLKSQLNPHFMFNAMNVIRALVDESPVRSKDAITQLSQLLRNTLQFSKHKFISLGQELEVVRDYLSLESARMEERLRVKWDVDTGCETIEVPPLMLQTLVENCIKHGLAKIPEGGEVIISAKCTSDKLNIRLENSGSYDASIKPESGFGLKNSRERLELLYGKDATLDIRNSVNNTVITELTLPKTRKS